MYPALRVGAAPRRPNSYEEVRERAAAIEQLVEVPASLSPRASVAGIRNLRAVLASDVAAPGVSVVELPAALSLSSGLMALCSWRRGTLFSERLYRTAKRGIDVVLSIALLTITLPITVGAALLVRMTSKGPIFYLQERCGWRGRRFKVIKFRSMVRDADKRVAEMEELASATGLRTANAPAFKSADDPRITRVGRILRRTNLDELPQLLNVLLGDMSLVGPRPLVPEEAACLESDMMELRHSVRPGLTCLWQVLREEETTFSERIELDLLYTMRGSLALDLALIAMTPLAIASGNGSY